MTEHSEKISPVFAPFMADTGAKVKRDAIVIYRASRPRQRAVRGRLAKLQSRLAAVKKRAQAQRPIEAKIFESYRKATVKHLGRGSKIAMACIGNRALPVAAVQVTRKTLPELAKQKDVVAILPNQRIHLLKPKEVDYDELGTQEFNDGVTWGLKKLGIPDIWALTKGAGIKVGVLDTGVHAEHPALQGKVDNFVVVDPLGRRITASPAFDGGDHGTHVCGTIAGGKDSDDVSIGVAPAARLLVAGVLIGDSTLQTLLEGISWAVENGADIISMSLGFTYYEPLFVEVFQMLLDLDILPVIAIGNENHGNTSSPGSAHNALSVGALEKMPGGKFDVAFFSSGASLTLPSEDPALVIKPDVVAPGVQVYSSIPPFNTSTGTIRYTYMGGTSMATPHVAGVAALLMSAKPTAPVADIVEAIKQTAKHPVGGDQRPDNRWGFGLIDPLAALNAL